MWRYRRCVGRGRWFQGRVLVLVSQQTDEVFKLLLQLGGPGTDLSPAIALPYRLGRLATLLQPVAPVDTTRGTVNSTRSTSVECAFEADRTFHLLSDE